MALYRAIDGCRSCGSERIPQVLHLGNFAISDFKDSADAFTDRAPLELVRCADCSLVQLRHTVDRDRLYKTYWYRSGTQPAMVQALRDVVADARSRVSLVPGVDIVVDIGANDGTLLREYPEGLIRVAYEPAENLWPLLQGEHGPWSPNGIRNVYGYFPTVVKGQVVGGLNAKVITSIACFYDVDDPNQFVEGIKANLHPDGVWINQMAYLPETLRTGNFGDICHEHLTYWTAAPFAALLRKHDMHVVALDLNDVNGGSVRFTVAHGDGPFLQIRHQHDWAKFRERIHCQRNDVRDFLVNARNTGRKVIGYGASTKGNTYLQYWNVGPDLLPLIADRNPDKFGKYTPTGQLVISEQEARDLQPDYFFVLPWHFLSAFVEREHLFFASGGQFAVPFPELHFVGGADAGLQQAGSQTGSRAAD